MHPFWVYLAWTAFPNTGSLLTDDSPLWVGCPEALPAAAADAQVLFLWMTCDLRDPLPPYAALREVFFIVL